MMQRQELPEAVDSFSQEDEAIISNSKESKRSGSRHSSGQESQRSKRNKEIDWEIYPGKTHIFDFSSIPELVPSFLIELNEIIDKMTY